MSMWFVSQKLRFGLVPLSSDEDVQRDPLLFQRATFGCPYAPLALAAILFEDIMSSLELTFLVVFCAEMALLLIALGHPLLLENMQTSSRWVGMLSHSSEACVHFNGRTC